MYAIAILPVLALEYPAPTTGDPVKLGRTLSLTNADDMRRMVSPVL